MARTKRRINVEEVERDGEAEAHRRRREAKQQIRDAIEDFNGHNYEELDDDEFDTFERIRSKKPKR